MHINFVSYDPAGSDTGTNAHINKEIVVIKNSTGKARILTGWTLRDRAGHGYRFPFTRLRPGHSVTVHTGKGHNRPGQRYWGQGNCVWNNEATGLPCAPAASNSSTGAGGATETAQPAADSAEWAVADGRQVLGLAAHG